MHKGVGYALLAAILFGASTPFSKILVTELAPITLAGILYLGSGIGLLVWFALRALIVGRQREVNAYLTLEDLPWLAGAILAGGICGPVLLMFGLSLTAASTTSLLLNTEGVFTALLAWFVFKENFDKRIFFGMMFIVIAGVLLVWQEQGAHAGMHWGGWAILAACFCWAIDNNLTRKIAAGDAVQIAGIKGLVAGTVSLVIAQVQGFSMPSLDIALTAGVVGFCGYGLSLVAFVLALRHLGTARTGAYFSIAPFTGAAISLLVLGEIPDWGFWLAAVLMAIGIWLHMTEMHRHQHIHAQLFHTHAHSHGIHHRHTHDFPCDINKSHVHAHQHERLDHAHPHFPDIHHRHQHDEE